MIQSMTGYGKATKEFSGKQITVEIRSLNSKQLDINLKIPASFREKEHEIRSIIGAKLIRGKIEAVIVLENPGGEPNYCIDKKLAKNYFQELKKLSDELGIDTKDYLSVITRLPDMYKPVLEGIPEEDQQHLNETIQHAADQLEAFRKQEGQILEAHIRENIEHIQHLLPAITACEKERIENIKERIRKNLQEFMSGEQYDENRFEQELFYYIEKLDITEEKVRLLKHCNYFLDTLADEEANGKKLGFICQEIGREINTLGSKANHAGMQKLVVIMKDELEKIKEQLLNIL